jgi:hypothetical protein
MVGRSKGEEGERKAPSKHYFANLKNQLIEFNDEVSTYADTLKSLCLLSVVSVKGKEPSLTFPAVHHTPFLFPFLTDCFPSHYDPSGSPGREASAPSAVCSLALSVMLRTWTGSW